MCARIEQGLLGERARGDEAHHVAADHGLGPALLGLCRVLDLLADRHPVASRNQPLEIVVGGNDRHAAHGDVLAQMLATLGERDAESARGDFRVLEEQLVEIAHAVEQETVGIGRLDLQILGDHGRGADHLVGARRARPCRLAEASEAAPHSRIGHRQGVAFRPPRHKGGGLNLWGKDFSTMIASSRVRPAHLVQETSPSSALPNEPRTHSPRSAFERAVSRHAEGSCLVRFGDTHVLCTATAGEPVPPWLKGQGRGWVTAEYGMLPRATSERTRREASAGKQTGRTQEIQRLIGRSLRAVTDLSALGEKQIVVDCDVLQADGGTRTASITGAWVALHDAIAWMQARNMIKAKVLRDHVAAVSCGLYGGEAVLDLDYAEDSEADADANFVMTGSGGIVEVQGTAETDPFSQEQFDQLMALARQGIAELVALQKLTVA